MVDDATEAVLYVGRSRDIWARWTQQHDQAYALRAGVWKRLYIEWIALPPDALKAAETQYIHTLDPLLNEHRKRVTPPQSLREAWAQLFGPDFNGGFCG